MPIITCIDDLRQLHRRRAPKMFFDYAESGSFTEQTFRENTTDFTRIRLRQRVGRQLDNRSTRTTMLGQEVAMPVALSPVGMAGMQSADGEIKAARAAARFGVPFTLSTMSICSIEDVARHADAPFWFQLYVMRDETFVDNIIDRAKAAGCSALVLTLDLQLVAQRHKDLKNRLSAPPRPSVATVLDLATRWRWGLQMLRTRRHTFRNIIGHAKGVDDIASLMNWSNEQFDPLLNWDKVARIRDRWGGKLVIKGILEAEDAERAADLGTDAIIVSNHGGRQLDGALSTIRSLAPVVAAVGQRTEVWLDGGIRTGQDVLKALAMGARGTMIGRAYIYGLGAMGEAGVTRALEIIHNELDTSMALCGRKSVTELDRDNILVPKGFEGDWQ
jgi:L-lactate dehydrogenase (cytochrome)